MCVHMCVYVCVCLHLFMFLYSTSCSAMAHGASMQSLRMQHQSSEAIEMLLWLSSAATLQQDTALGASE